MHPNKAQTQGGWWCSSPVYILNKQPMHFRTSWGRFRTIARQLSDTQFRIGDRRRGRRWIAWGCFQNGLDSTKWGYEGMLFGFYFYFYMGWVCGGSRPSACEGVIIIILMTRNGSGGGDHHSHLFFVWSKCKVAFTGMRLPPHCSFHLHLISKVSSSFSAMRLASFLRHLSPFPISTAVGLVVSTGIEQGKQGKRFPKTQKISIKPIHIVDTSGVDRMGMSERGVAQRVWARGNPFLSPFSGHLWACPPSFQVPTNPLPLLVSVSISEYNLPSIEWFNIIPPERVGSNWPGNKKRKHERDMGHVKHLYKDQFQRM